MLSRGKCISIPGCRVCVLFVILFDREKNVPPSCTWPSISMKVKISMNSSTVRGISS